MLVSPENFGIVEPGIYRCSKLEIENFQFLETLLLKSIISLDAEKPPRMLQNFLQTNKIELYNLGDLKISNHQHTGLNSKIDLDEFDNDSRNKNDDTISQSSKSSTTSSSTLTNKDSIITTKSISLKSKENKNNGGDQWMLIEKNIIIKTFELIFNNKKHPILLIDSTSTIVGILRKIQKWNFNSILNEYRIFNGNSNKNNYFAETFLELISIELIPNESRKSKSPFGSRRNSIKNLNNPGRNISGPSQLQQLMKSPNFDDSKDSNQDNKLNLNEIDEKLRGQVIEDSNTGGDTEIDEDEGFEDDIDEAIDDDYDSLDDMDDLDDDLDDDLLSASPQIPANLLKFVEQRKQDKQQQQQLQSQDISNPNSRNNSIDSNSKNLGSSPKLIIQNSNSRSNSGPNSRNNSLNTPDSYLNLVRGMDRRKSSGDIIKTNLKFRNSSISSESSSSKNFPKLSSLESTSPILKKKNSYCSRRSSSNNISPNEETTTNVTKPKDYKYYKNLNKYPIKFEDINTIKLKLPPEYRLPEWFIKNRDMWEYNYRILNQDD
ncbi:uncharacterized protein KGF55_003128 [Candida pseudojiufengensis]|uniref:uncharacterized protein n=1 Tax=Candida pseudojiufengensis TaxID=497109 RepID=UPI00222500C6|nr:uncharacterized protein KGF55_003128 [Candida pseudojiufengensis]KAI5963336.1 hypothetical protein KGF55_003128 [Candida pseudojiufengensis]